MSVLERAIAAVAPRYAARRAMARVQLGALDQIERRSGGRKRFREDTNFGVNTGHPDDARPRRFIDRATVLRLAYENPYGRKAIDALVNNAVGWGITGAPKGPKAVSTLWLEWIKVADYRGRLDLFGLQELAVRTMFREGESFLVRRYVRDAAIMPLRIQVLDAGMLATDKVGDNIEDGIEYDADGNVAGYWFYPARSQYRRNRPAVRFAAIDVTHLYVQEEAGQKRGRSVFEPVIKRLGDIDDALDADLVRRKIESCFVGFRTLNWEDGDQPLGIRESRGDNLPPSEFFEPGTINTLAPGEDIKFGTPKPMGGLGEAVRINLLATAAGIGVTYEQLTGDLSNVNYSSYRAGALEFDAKIERIQWNTIIPVGLNRVWAWFCQAAFEFGRIAKPIYEMRWTPPPRKSIDRKGDAEADILEMQAGLENRRSLLNARGTDHDIFMEETQADLQSQQGKGLFYKGDPFTAAQAQQSTDTPSQGATT
ncbi:phage portal protein [Sphingobium sp. RAC03]|uniref:phage portal protein n=1 Tax=Sphingobium sp. RAC03 TaxID=1843368 RepID=UPI0008584710|nr:phage portal protein [Sphingobium sp. RAC03]AOF97330.1 phage portal protein, lambda family [Sphingobium sp. RAC03]